MFDSAPHPPPRKLLSPAGGGPTATPPLVRPSHQRPPYSVPRTTALRGFSPARSISPSGTLAAAPAGRPPLLGRQGSSPLTLAQQPSSLLLAGRQSPAANSPLLLHKGLAAAAAASNSPAMRRQRKVPALGRLQQTAMRKSLSLDSVAVTAAAAGHLSQLPEREGEDRSSSGGGQNHRYPREAVEETDSGGGGGHPAQREEDLEDGDDGDGDGETRTKSGPESPPPLEVPVIRFQEVVSARGDPHLAAAFSSTLPRPLSRHRNISRSLVPKMRRMFEKARSADPDFSPPPSPLRLTVPAGEDDSAVSPPPRPHHHSRPAMMGHQDGTESARSSFVLLGPDGGGRSESSLADSSLELSEGSPVLADRKGARSGFVNKCVTKVKSFMGKSQDRL
jgi:hypothetical protein